MDDERWRGMRESGIRVLLAGLFSLLIAFVIYARLTVPSSDFVIQSQHLMNLAYTVLAITAASTASMIYGAYTFLRSEQLRSAGGSSLISYVTGVFAARGFWRVAAVAAVGYGIFFGFLSQILVYRADVSFAEKGIPVPSVEIIPCCSAPGYVPMLTAYVTDHFLFLIIPVNLVLATLVSVLVGFNVALSLHAYKLRKSLQPKMSFVGGIGAATGLFVGCPTCAGSFLSALLGIGIASAGTTATVLAPLQTLFIAASMPALVIAPFLIARSIRSVSSCRVG